MSKMPVAEARSIVRDALRSLGVFSAEMESSVKRMLGEIVVRDVPPRLSSVFSAWVDDEMLRERSFGAKMAKRLGSDLRAALESNDPEGKAEIALSRERTIINMRIAAIMSRADGLAARLTIEDRSPEGAFWLPGEGGASHPGCIALSNAFWPWEVLRRVWAPLHPGCKCRLATYDDAVKYGLMTREIPDPVEAVSKVANVQMEW